MLIRLNIQSQHIALSLPIEIPDGTSEYQAVDAFIKRMEAVFPGQAGFPSADGEEPQNTAQGSAAAGASPPRRAGRPRNKDATAGVIQTATADQPGSVVTQVSGSGNVVPGPGYVAPAAVQTAPPPASVPASPPVSVPVAATVQPATAPASTASPGPFMTEDGPLTYAILARIITAVVAAGQADNAKATLGLFRDAQGQPVANAKALRESDWPAAYTRMKALINGGGNLT